MPKPDASQFAKTILWHLTGLRADATKVMIYILEQKAMQTGRSHQELLDEWNNTSVPHHNTLYREALALAGLQDDPVDTDENSPSDDDESTPLPPRA